MKRIMFVAAVLMISVAAFGQELTIIHVNDTHSHVDPIRGGQNDGFGGVIETAAYVDSVRVADGKKNVLFLHAGDFSQGTSYFPMLHGDMEIDILNELKVDASVLGNHEFDNGFDELARRLGNAKFDVVCANYEFPSAPDLAKHIKPYTIIRRAGKKIGIIGVLVKATDMIDYEYASKMVYLDPVEVSNKYADMLREKGCDLIIVLSHIGTERTQPSDMDIAANTTNVDIVVGGHTHTFLDAPRYVKNLEGREVMVVTDGCWGIYVGNLKVSF